MIVNSFGHYLSQTVHDHGTAPPSGMIADSFGLYAVRTARDHETASRGLVLAWLAWMQRRLVMRRGRLAGRRAQGRLAAGQARGRGRKPGMGLGRYGRGRSRW
jgi:hypothetical protein